MRSSSGLHVRGLAVCLAVLGACQGSDEPPAEEGNGVSPGGAAASVDLGSLTVGRNETAVRYLADVDAGIAVYPLPQVSPPARGSRERDPSFGTTIRRLDTAPWATHEYSQLQAFSHDSRFVLLSEGPDEDSMARVVRRWPEMDIVLPAGGSSTWNVPRWHPALHSRIVHFDSNEDTTLRLQETEVESGTTETVFTFPAEYQRIRVNQSFDEISRDGRWLAGMASLASGGQAIFALDIADRRLGAVLDLDQLYRGPCTPDPEWGNVEPDWTGVSPLGTYLAVQWAASGVERCQGLETFDVDSGTYVGRLTAEHPHGDLALLADGTTEVFVSTELSGPGAGESYVGGESGGTPAEENYPTLSLRRLPGPPAGSQPPEHLYLVDWIVDHISCRGPSGYCLVTAGSNPLNGGLDPLEAELFIIRLDGSGLTRLAHHHSSSASYWQQPRASISNDGRYVVFDSDWGTNAPPGPSSVYTIDLAE